MAKDEVGGRLQEKASVVQGHHTRWGSTVTRMPPGWWQYTSVKQRPTQPQTDLGMLHVCLS
jgi:hypothetical protein